MFQVGITYGVSYLRSAMLKGNKTAASALTRKIGVNNIDQVAKKWVPLKLRSTQI